MASPPDNAISGARSNIKRGVGARSPTHGSFGSTVIKVRQPWAGSHDICQQEKAKMKTQLEERHRVRFAALAPAEVALVRRAVLARWPDEPWPNSWDVGCPT